MRRAAPGLPQASRNRAKSAAAIVNVRGVDVRMKRQTRRRLQVAIEDDADVVLAIVDEAKGRHRPRRQAEMRHQPLGRREAQLAVADLIGHGPQVGLLRCRQHHEVVAVPFLVSQKEILAVRRVDAGPVRLASSTVATGGCSCRV